MTGAEVLVLGIVAAACGLALELTARKFAVKADERIEKVLEALPGSNCGACGYGGCAALAEAVVRNADAFKKIPRCIQGGDKVMREIEEILKVQIAPEEKKVAMLLCSGGVNCAQRFIYEGINDCREVVFLNEEGDKACGYACIGHGTCEKVCPFDAIMMGADRLPCIDKKLCRGCGLCVNACPKKVLRLASISELYYVACSSKDKGSVVKKICKTGCIACGICEKACPIEPVKAVKVESNLAAINPALCSGCGACAEKCPRKVILKFSNGAMKTSKAITKPVEAEA